MFVGMCINMFLNNGIRLAVIRFNGINSLKNLKSQLKQLGQKVEEKIIAHKDILSRCWNFFIDYVCSSINFMLCLLLAGLLKH